MSLKPSVKDFVLQYFDRLGATIQVADEIYTVQPQADLAGTWPFADPFLFSFSRRDDEQWTHIALGSPVLKQMIEDVTSRGKVTSRHLMANAVPTLNLFATKLAPTNGTVSGFTFVRSEQPRALCFAHLVTYDAPAFGKCEAEIQIDVLDARTGERDDFLSEKLFDLVTVPYQPDMAMDGDKIDWLHERSRYLSNWRSEKQARKLEDELKLRWQSEEKRINSYYDQLAASLKEKESTLVARIETLEGKISEAKDGTIGKEKLQAELDLVWTKLRELNTNNETNLSEISDGRDGKLAAEKVRHELTVRSELVNVSFLTYDAVTFKVAIEGPGKLGEIEVNYLPIKDALEMPTCPHCTQMIHGMVIDSSGHIICASCAEHCPRCNESLCPTCRRSAIVLGSCDACQSNQNLFVPLPVIDRDAVIAEPTRPAISATGPLVPSAPPVPFMAGPLRGLLGGLAPKPPAPEPVAAPTPDRGPARVGSISFPFEKTNRVPTQPADSAQATADRSPRAAAAPKAAGNRQLQLPKINRQKSAEKPYARVESRMCPHCSTIVMTQLAPCTCCGISVCGDCVSPGSRACQTCATLGVPRQEPAWVRLVKQQRKELAKVKKYHVSANERYGVIHWQAFAGDKLLVYDLWQKQVVSERRGSILRSLRPKVAR
ncbi:MAG: hypothetical protein H7338_25145 [Candidatus Sericytochromatia bacterium]|nr:hypothetical protein [Candidatus Sericytochromatia bacterium]